MRMSQTEMEDRLAVLEKEVTSLKSKFAKIENSEPWWKGRIGIFADDAQHEEATQLGRKWRKDGSTNGNTE